MDNEDKNWMNLPRYTNEYMDGVNEFLNKAFERGAQGNKILCPCKNCSNRKWLYRNVVGDHLVVDGFIDGYTRWVFHGEYMMEKLQNSGKPSDADILAEFEASNARENNTDMIAKLQNLGKPIDPDILAALCACSTGEASTSHENNIGGPNEGVGESDDSTT